ncbi:lipase family protein [Streptomyces flaveolus]|uniref:lipase family protein n=1 Tax=Streptomyces flaveolus TaxID=67297 RepID=UPI003F55EBBD
MGLRGGAPPSHPVHPALPAPGHPGLHPGERPDDRHRVPRHRARPDQGLALRRHHPAPARTGGHGYVHHGFAEALAAVHPAVHDTLTELRTDGQAVYFTGHGLGGALAMLAGARLYLEEPHLAADGVYTYGQPRTCDRLLAEAFGEGFGGRMYRFVNNNDIVAQLPPEPAYTHVRALRYFDSKGRLHESMPMLSALGDRARGLTADPFAPASDGVRDHSMHAYLAVLEQNLA